MSIEDKIKNVELLTEAFGRFPTFHDAAVEQIVLDRGDWKSNTRPNLLAKIRVLKLVSKDNGNGNWLWSHHLVELRFSGIDNVSLQGFNLQNVLFDLHIEEDPAAESSLTRYAVLFESTYGVEIEFKCSEITVEAVGAAQLHQNKPVDEKTKQERQRLIGEHLRRRRGDMS